MLEIWSQVHHDKDTSIIWIMSEKTSIGPFPWKVKTNIKSLKLLTLLTCEYDLGAIFHANHSVPMGAEYQIPFVVHAVLVRQEKSHIIQMDCKYTTSFHCFTPPCGARVPQNPPSALPLILPLLWTPMLLLGASLWIQLLISSSRPSGYQLLLLLHCASPVLLSEMS